MIGFYLSGKLLCAVSAKESSVQEIISIKELLACENGCHVRDIEVDFGGGQV